MDDTRPPAERHCHRLAAGPDPEPRRAGVLVCARGRSRRRDPARVRPGVARPRASPGVDHDASPPGAARGIPARRPRLRARHAIQATAPEAGRVRIHAMKMSPATPHRTAEKRSLAPTPMIAVEMTCVVETGMPNCDA